MEDRIKFSYIELTNSNFEFTIYRKPYDRNIILENEYRYTLPLSDRQLDIKDDYAVSFIAQEDSSEFLCSSSFNIHLTKKWLMSMLINKVTESFKPKDYILGKHLIPNISFILSSQKEGMRLIQIEPYYLEVNNSFGYILDYKFKPSKGYEKTREEKLLSLSIAPDGSKNKNFYSDKLKIVGNFIETIVPSIFPLNIGGLSIDVKKELTSLETKLLNEKTYIFYDGEGSVQFQGIRDYKPLSTVSGNPIFIFIFEKSKVNTARELVKALRGELYSTFTGMQKMFGVEFTNNNILSIQVDGFSKRDLSTIDTKISEIVSENSSSPIVGIFVGIARDFDEGKDYSPYYTLKNIFLKKGLALQAITIEQALKRDGFKWSISGIALQLFVKLGGQPWKVKPQNEDCIIFGISCAHIKDENQKIKKYFAYSLCFDSSGIYKKLDILGQADDETTYIEQLTFQIKKNLQDKLTENIRKCAIHIPFKIKKKEIKCIKDSVNEIKKTHEDIEIAFIKINIQNKFFGYSNYNSRIPLAGSYIELGQRQFLIWFEGLQQGNTHVVSAQNISNPVYIEFIDCPNLSEDQIKSYLQDIINLSGANWRGFNAKHEPVTTLYPELIAKFAGKFEQYGLELSIGESALDKVWFI